MNESKVEIRGALIKMQRVLPPKPNSPTIVDPFLNDEIEHVIT